MLKKFNHFNSTSISTPYDSYASLGITTGRTISQLEYSRVIDSLIYAIISTRSHIAFTVDKFSRYTNNLGHTYWQSSE